MFYNDPWPHYVTDNYFDRVLFEHCSWFAHHIPCDPGKREQVYIRPNEGNGKMIADAFVKHCSSMGMVFDPTKHNIQVEFNVCGVGYDYNIIHTDAVNKIFSTVVYLSENGHGTPLYQSNDIHSLAKTVEWKPNRALSFLRSDHSWHDFGCGDYNEPRRTLTLVVVAK